MKQFPHLKDIVLEGLKAKSSKNLFKKLNEHSKNLKVKQEEIAKKHNSLLAQHEELEHIKNNMNEYMCREKRDKKKESVIGAIYKHKRKIDETIGQSHSTKNDMELYKVNGEYYKSDTLRFLMQLASDFWLKI